MFETLCDSEIDIPLTFRESSPLVGVTRGDECAQLMLANLIVRARVLYNRPLQDRAEMLSVCE